MHSTDSFVGEKQFDPLSLIVNLDWIVVDNMEAAVLNQSAAIVMLEAKLMYTQNNLNDFFIIISAILVFGKINNEPFRKWYLLNVLFVSGSHAGWILADGSWISAIQKRYQHSSEEHSGCL